MLHNTALANSPQLPLPDLSSCDREPIHIPGAIQPHGVLLAVEGAGRKIVFVSSNCAEWLHQSADQLIDRSLDSLLPPGSVALLNECLAECSEATSSIRMLQFASEKGDGDVFSASAHRSGDSVIIELERATASVALEGQEQPNFLGKCRLVFRQLGLCGSIEQFFQLITVRLRSLTGYDRIMVYQFDEEANGTVLAEQCAEGMESYLGLHYPATDIPAQARAMLLLNDVRLIPDARYQPVPLFPSVHPRTGNPLDLGRAHLRSVSPIHLEYLRNMEVGASLTISLVVDDKLWGLIACHHRMPRYLSSALREACELFGQMVSMQLTERLRAAGNKMAEKSSEVLQRLSERIHRSESIIPALLQDPNDLLALTNAQGAVLWRDGAAMLIGATPPLEAIAALQEGIANASSNGVFATDCLPKLFQGAESYADVASGLIALAVSRAPDVFILWFRPEVITTVDWAGDPDKSTEPSSQDGGIHPRRSFARWKKSVRHRSLPWLKGEISAVEQLRTVLQDRLARTAEQLARLIPICAWCKKVRSDPEYWQQVETYVEKQLDIRFTHGICPECLVQEKEKYRQLRDAQ